jgi:hypothetical protein
MFKVNEGSTARLSFLITDYDGSAVPVSNISTATMSISDYDTNTVIVADQNIKTNITELGICTVYLAGSTNTIITETKPYEKHIISIVVSGVGLSAPQITNETIYQVNNMKLR